MVSTFLFAVLFASLASMQATSPPKVDVPEPKPSLCPHDESIENFDIKKMLGKWYVVEESTTIPLESRGSVKPIPGQTVEITESTGKYHLKHTVGHTNPYVHNFIIVQENRNIQHYSPESVNELKFAVVATDYANVALIITCTQSFSHTRTAQILLKNKNIDQKFIDEMHSKLAEHGFNVQDMMKIEL